MYDGPPYPWTQAPVLSISDSITSIVHTCDVQHIEEVCMWGLYILFGYPSGLLNRT